MHPTVPLLCGLPHGGESADVTLSLGRDLRVIGLVHYHLRFAFITQKPFLESLVSVSSVY